jgi:hypothetical protein
MSNPVSLKSLAEGKADGIQKATYFKVRPEDVAEVAATLLGTQAARDVLAERRRQVEAEGWTPEHDDQHEVGELATAAACYAGNAGGYVWAGGWPGEVWPWAREWWKPSTPRRDLVKAAALILAEIERLDRAEEGATP